MKKIMLLGSGELGKELVIAFQRLGQYVIAVDNYEGAPAHSVAQVAEVIDMLNGEALQKLVDKHQPDIIVPEIEAIRTEQLQQFEDRGIQVVPSAKAAHYTMNRKAIRDLAAKELGLKTARYAYASNRVAFEKAVQEIGIPCVIKPLMSSSGKGQSVIKTEEEISKAWQYALEGSRGDLQEVIIEEFIHFDFEITLLTLTQKNGPTLFCAPIGHRQERGDYQESWQPIKMDEVHLREAQRMAAQVTEALGGAGIWGVEFFITKDGAYFSELSPRPHDTGMVTLANTQNLNEFELHARAILGIPVPRITLLRHGASVVLLADRNSSISPRIVHYDFLEGREQVDFRWFGKPNSRPYRRMGVLLQWGDEAVDVIVDKLKEVAKKVEIGYTAEK